LGRNEEQRVQGSRNPAIIHDLRPEVNGRVVQTDHLLLHRTLKVFVLETKHPRVLKAAMLSVEEALKKRGLLTGIGGIIRFISSPTLEAIGQQRVALHKTATINFAARFGLASSPVTRAVSTASATRSSRVVSTPKPRPTIRWKTRPNCRHCGSDPLTLRPGRFSFHFGCTTCNEHTPIAWGCPGHRECIRQDAFAN
jgi:hypothetical protein